MLGVFTAVNAQTYVCDLDGCDLEAFVIPGDFTNSGHPYITHITYSGDGHLLNFSIYQSDLTTPVTTFNNVSYPGFYYIDYDNLSEVHYIAFTQTLFNDDAYFEYFDYEEETYTVYDTIGAWYDEEEGVWYYEVEEYNQTYTTAINVKSANGSTIWTYRRPEGMLTCGLNFIFKLDNKYYMCIYTYNENNENRYPLFIIKQNQGITEINNTPFITAFPTMPTRDQQITVDLGEGTNAHEITVVNGLGQELKRIPLEEGQRTVTIPARELGRGLNVLNARSDCNQGNCKIIVR